MCLSENESSLCVCGLSIEIDKNGSCLCENESSLSVCLKVKVIVCVSE